MDGKSSGEATYRTLIESLRNGQYQPGDRLREEEVSERLSVSRTPVREALRRLEAEGIVEHKARQGAVIRRLSHAEVVELYEMRVVLERTAAEFAAQHGAEAEFDALDDINQKIDDERANPAMAAAINQDFHRGLYRACRNRFLLQAARSLNNSLLLLGPTTFTDEVRVETVVAQHGAIVAALRARDSSAAGEAAAHHLNTSLRARLQSIQD